MSRDADDLDVPYELELEELSSRCLDHAESIDCIPDIAEVLALQRLPSEAVVS